jgi:hypothetical protein
MLYKFKSKAAGDVIMLGPNGDQVMRLLGRQPAPKGIFEAAHLPMLIGTLEKAVAADEAARQQAEDDPENENRPGKGDGVSLRQRVWPLVEMMRRAAAAREPIVWGT